MEQGEKLIVAQPAVAIVDDDAAVLNSLKFSLEIEGFAVRLFRGAQDILREPDLSGCGCLLIDYNMPGINGLDLLGKLREKKITAPAVLMTAKADGSLHARAAAAGVPVVEKPFNGNALTDVIRNALAQKRPER
jgi:FixJ family two-component response regulator